MRTINKLTPSRTFMCECFGNYLKATGKKDATFEQVVMSPHGLGWEGTYSEWLNSNHFRNKTMILKWQTQNIDHAWHLKKVRRGHYFPTRGDSRQFHTRNTTPKAVAKTTVPVKQLELNLIPATAAVAPTTPQPTTIKGVLVLPVTSVARFHNIVDLLKGVLDDPDHAFLTNLLNSLGV